MSSQPAPHRGWSSYFTGANNTWFTRSYNGWFSGKGNAMPDNDPYGAHQSKMSTRSKYPAREMLNVAADPFATGPSLGGIAHRPRIKVAIVSASGLRDTEWIGKTDPYVICQVPGKRRSMFQTPVINNTQNPVWGFRDHIIMGWVPGDPLLFTVYDKDLILRDTVLGEAELPSSWYFPDQWSGDLPLRTSRGTQGLLRVQVETVGLSEGDRVRYAAWRCCGVCKADMRQCGAFLRTLPPKIYEAVRKLVGPPDPDRDPRMAVLMMMIPFAAFMFTIATWLFIRHFSELAAIWITVILCVACLLIFVSGLSQKKTKLPLTILGLLCLLGVWTGFFAALWAWDYSYRQWWWMQTGIEYGGTTGSTPAAARSDASLVAFTPNETLRSSVDSFKSAGYRNGDIYCAAPILDADSNNVDIISVNYWAIGINCCNDFGSFTCDSARELSGTYGVVMVQNGMPCASCNREEFRLAALKSSGKNGMVVSPGALFVRFVTSANEIRDVYMTKCILIAMLCIFLGLLLLGTLGYLANFKGWGKPGQFPFYQRRVVTAPLQPHKSVNWDQY